MPKVTISGIASNEYLGKDVTKLKKSICNKNPTINSLVEKGKTFEVMFIKEDARQKNSSVAVVKVDTDILNEIRNLRYKIYIDFSRCHVQDRFHLVQCYKCQQYGHTNNNCPTNGNNMQVCRYCAGNHQSKSCPHKGDTAQYKCINCGQNHSSTYYKCSVVQGKLQSLLNHTQGMEKIQKNEVRPHSIVT